MTLLDRLVVGEVGAQVFLRGPGVTDPSLDPEPALVSAIGGTKTSFYALVFSITLPSVAAALKALHDRLPGSVHLVCDAVEAKGKTSQVPGLFDYGLDVRLWGGNYREAHDKVAVIDGASLVTGSYNWSTLAERSNIENMFILKGSRITKVVVPPFMSLWNSAYSQGVTPS